MRFPLDHPIAALRGYEISPAQVRRSLAKRIEWLVDKYDPTRRRRDRFNDPLLDELASIALAVEALSEQKG